MEDRLVGNTLLNFYAKCRYPVDGRKVFDQMPQRDVCSWTVMIAAYAKNGHCEEALRLFYQMREMAIQPNQFTFASILRRVPTWHLWNKAKRSMKKLGGKDFSRIL
jgi:pentatricopeptide repeat protein